MDYAVHTKYQPCTLQVEIRSLTSCTVCLQVNDPYRPGTCMLERTYEMVGGVPAKLYAQLPCCNEYMVVRVYNNADGSDMASVRIRKYGLTRKNVIADLLHPGVSEWIAFRQKFCYNAGWAPVNKVYSSALGTFKINYVDQIFDDHGNPFDTPMQIDETTRVINAAKNSMVRLTVPRRVVIADHEYCHMFQNKDRYDETEADCRGVAISMDTGWSHIECLEAFQQLFQENDSPENEQRFHIVEDFIYTYRKEKFNL